MEKRSLLCHVSCDKCPGLILVGVGRKKSSYRPWYLTFIMMNEAESFR